MYKKDIYNIQLASVHQWYYNTSHNTDYHKKKPVRSPEKILMIKLKFFINIE